MNFKKSNITASTPIGRILTATLFTLALSLPAFAQQSPQILYSTDMVDAQFAEALVHGEEPVNVLPETTPYNADMVNIENIVGDGEGVYVAVLDTGLLPDAPFFFSQAHVAWDLGKGFSHDIYWDDTIQDIVIDPVNGDRGYTTELASGHGTHVASTVVGYNLVNSSWIRGIAPKATIIPVLVLDAWEIETPFGTIPFSGGTNEMISEGIRYVADLTDTLDGRIVINMSLGGSSRSAMIEAAIDYAISKGVVVVASAGNSGNDGMGYPGALPQVISTGAAGWSEMFATDDWWRSDVPESPKSKDSIGNNSRFYLEDFSSRPVKALGQVHRDLDVTAPGAWVVGPYKSAFANNTGYYFLSGTSMSAPHVSAIAAMLVGQEPTLSHADVEQRLRHAGHGNPLPSDGAVVAFPFNADGYYPANWNGGDYGTGFLQADQVVD